MSLLDETQAKKLRDLLVVLPNMNSEAGRGLILQHVPRRFWRDINTSVAPSLFVHELVNVLNADSDQNAGRVSPIVEFIHNLIADDPDRAINAELQQILDEAQSERMVGPGYIDSSNAPPLDVLRASIERDLRQRTLAGYQRAIEVIDDLLRLPSLASADHAALSTLRQQAEYEGQWLRARFEFLIRTRAEGIFEEEMLELHILMQKGETNDYDGKSLVARFDELLSQKIEQVLREARIDREKGDVLIRTAVDSLEERQIDGAVEAFQRIMQAFQLQEFRSPTPEPVREERNGTIYHIRQQFLNNQQLKRLRQECQERLQEAEQLRGMIRAAKQQFDEATRAYNQGDYRAAARLAELAQSWLGRTSAQVTHLLSCVHECDKFDTSDEAHQARMVHGQLIQSMSKLEMIRAFQAEADIIRVRFAELRDLEDRLWAYINHLHDHMPQIWRGAALSQRHPHQYDVLRSLVSIINRLAHRVVETQFANRLEHQSYRDLIALFESLDLDDRFGLANNIRRV